MAPFCDMCNNASHHCVKIGQELLCPSCRRCVKESWQKAKKEAEELDILLGITRLRTVIPIVMSNNSDSVCICEIGEE